MVPRYTRPQMAAIWSPENRYRIWFEIEALVAEAMARTGEIPAEAAVAIRERGAPRVAAITAADLDRIRRAAGDVAVVDRPEAAVEGAAVVVTDVWTSMGQEGEAEARRAAFAGWTVDGPLMARAHPDAVFLHCLPAHRGEEVAAEVVDGPRSLVWPEAANRMHAARGLLAWLVGEGAR